MNNWLALAGCLAALMLLSGCEEDDDLFIPAGTVKSSVPEQATFYDPATGQAVGRARFDYSVPLQITSEFQSAGDDGVLDSEDDVFGDYLGCRYTPINFPDGPRPVFALSGLASSPTGALLLSMMRFPDGKTMRCPTLPGHAVSTETFCINSGCPLPPHYSTAGYRLSRAINGTRSRTLETQVLELFSAGQRSENDTEVQTFDVSRDEQGRERLVITEVTEPDHLGGILATSCTAEDNFAIDLILFRSCGSLERVYRFEYDDARSEIEIERYSGRYYQHTLVSTRHRDADQDRIEVENRRLRPGAASADMRSLATYTLNRKGLATEVTFQKPGPDAQLLTADDDIVYNMQWVYRNANLLQTELRSSYVKETREYDDSNRLLFINRYLRGASQARMAYDYDGLQPIRQRLYELPSGQDELVLTHDIQLRPAIKGLPADFDLTELLLATPPDAHRLMHSSLDPY